MGALDTLWESVCRRCDFLDQGRHRLWVDSVQSDLWVEVGQWERFDVKVRQRVLDQGRL